MFNPWSLRCEVVLPQPAGRCVPALGAGPTGAGAWAGVGEDLVVWIADAAAGNSGP